MINCMLYNGRMSRNEHTIEPYLQAANQNPYTRSIINEHLPLFQWVSEQHPHLPIDQAVRWVGDIARSRLYRRTSMNFPVSYPFTCIQFDTFADSSAVLTLWPKCLFAQPFLNPLRQLPFSRGSYSGVMFEYRLPQLSAIELKQNVDQVMMAIDNHLVPNDPAQLFACFYRQLQAAIDAFIQDHHNGFPGLKFLQLRPPKPTKPFQIQLAENTSPLGDAISDSLRSYSRRYSLSEVEKLLAHGENPNAKQWALMLLNMVIRRVDSKSATAKREAEFRLALAELLIEYGADPGILTDPEHPSDYTTLNHVIDSFRSEKADALNDWLGQQYIKLLYRFDQGRSHLFIHSQYDSHPLAKMILAAQRAQAVENDIPNRVSSALPAWLMHRPAMIFRNTQQQSLYHTILSASELLRIPPLLEQLANLYQQVLPTANDTDCRAELVAKLSRQPLCDIDLLLNAHGHLMAFNLAQTLAIKSQAIVFHFIPLAGCLPQVSRHFRKLMTLISFQRILWLMRQYHCTVLTAYNAASAISFLQTLGMTVYPKYQCLSEDHWQVLRQVFFKDRNVIHYNGARLFPSKLHYSVEPKQSELESKQSIACKGFNRRYQLTGCSTVVAFYSTPANLRQLARNINSSLGGSLDFNSLTQASHSVFTTAASRL